MRGLFRKNNRTTEPPRAASVQLSNVSPTNPVEEMALQTLIALRGRFCRMDGGLSDRELSLAEERVGCTFPPDLAALLRIALPVADNFPAWRDLGCRDLQQKLERPTDIIVRGIDLVGWGAGDRGSNGTELKTDIPFWGHWLS